jgi:spore cortex formation protein SpoVR/YcgB (stage V sporulation)
LAAAAKELDENGVSQRFLSAGAGCCCSCWNLPLNSWQADVLSIIRDEVLLRPAGQTKIMNEGWASYWHSTIMTRQGS